MSDEIKKKSNKSVKKKSKKSDESHLIKKTTKSNLKRNSSNLNFISIEEMCNKFDGKISLLFIFHI